MGDKTPCRESSTEGWEMGDKNKIINFCCFLFIIESVTQDYYEFFFSVLLSDC